MTRDYLADRRAHLARCVSAMAEQGLNNDPANDRFALVAWGAWTPGKRPSTKLAKLEYRSRSNSKDTRVWGRVQTGTRDWAKFSRNFERDTVLATFRTCPSWATLLDLKKNLPAIPVLGG